MHTSKPPATKVSAFWIVCLVAAACATQGLRSAKTLSELADELYAEWLIRKG